MKGDQTLVRFKLQPQPFLNMLPEFRLTFSALFTFTCLAGIRADVTPDADNGGLQLPEGFRAAIVADRLMEGRKLDGQNDALRFLAEGPEGILYAKTARGGIFALSDKDGDGRFETKVEFGKGGGSGIAVHDGWLYHSTNSDVFRYRLTPGKAVPEGAQERIVRDLPNKGGHAAKSFAFDGQGRLLVEVGSPYNVYSEPDRQRGAKGMDPTEFQKTYGGFWRFDAAKPEQTQGDGFHFSSGHRHVLAVAWQPLAKDFFVVMMGRDNLDTVDPEHYDTLDNAERVSEEMHRLSEGAFLGWPFTYFDPHKKARMISPEFGGDNKKRAEAGKYPDPVVAFPAHWAPLQMAFYGASQFPEKYRNGAFVAFHGSWNRAPLPQDGYNVSFVPVDETGTPKGAFEVFARKAGEGHFRMGGLTVGKDGSIYLSETDIGRIWKVWYDGSSGAGAKTQAAVAMPDAGKKEEVAKGARVSKAGATLYAQYCATCHMADGSGAGSLQPALKGSSVVAGDAATLARVILEGPAAVLPKDRPKYSNVMPSYPFLNDKQVADLINYLRAQFGKGGELLTAPQVAEVRKK